ncbi:DNA-binding NarL/FixJ family response regulator [Kineosphaera limosa]|uniref:Putative two-component response regulator n=1 Tax=Kineosphaera limosa NBRC 100340 TaxID=1184609 RepID=K6WMP2_9MICO|nr:response regulator transcription factor [Kineosphaera limosa]NYE03026.1 DNA-binding NarL/FixJ family response regulator [Kineosphaera limosa]GAB95081.1 putative two-component response regulator [Kineosphaera limosa NBRC 100340]
MSGSSTPDAASQRGGGPTGQVVRVYLVDDHEIVRRGLRELLELESDVEVVGESGTATEAARRIPAMRPHVAVLDARLPDGSGIEVCRQIRAVDPSIRGLILTSFDDQQALTAAVLAGASGYLLKDIRGGDLVETIRRVARGESLLDPKAVALAQKNLTSPTATDPRLRSLTPQERRILVLVADGLTNRQIGSELFLAEKTVKNYITAILAKLGMERRTQAAVFAATHADQLGDHRP